MKRAILVVCICGVVAPGASLGDVIFSFDPDDLIQMYPALAGTGDVEGQNKATQLNARRTHQPWATNVYETFYNPANPRPQPDSYNTYTNWREGLGAGEGISGFNIWLLDNPNARSWGETTVWDPSGIAPTGTADALGKWNKSVGENPWGPGWIVSWWTEDPAHYLNTISDIGEFSFAGVAYRDLNENGYDPTDPEVQVGDEVRIWFGAVNWTESDGQGGWTHSWGLHFDDVGWGDRIPNDGGPWSAGLPDSEGYGSGYEGVLNITAIPEPATLALLGLSGLLAACRRR